MGGGGACAALSRCVPTWLLNEPLAPPVSLRKDFIHVRSQMSQPSQPGLHRLPRLSPAFRTSHHGLCCLSQSSLSLLCTQSDEEPTASNTGENYPCNNRHNRHIRYDRNIHAKRPAFPILPGACRDAINRVPTSTRKDGEPRCAPLVPHCTACYNTSNEHCNETGTGKENEQHGRAGGGTGGH